MTASQTVPETLTRRQARELMGLGPKEIEVAFRSLPVINLVPGREYQRVRRRDLQAWLIDRHGPPRIKREKRRSWRAHGGGTGCVILYVFTDGTVIKIGVTSRHVEVRRKNVETASGRHLRTVTTVRHVDACLEQMLHAEFAANRLIGEWFAIPDRFAPRFRSVLRQWLATEEKPW